MKFGKIKQTAQDFLRQYETQNPATYAAAQQAIGGLLMLDGFIGIDNPLGGKKRPGIFGSLIGVALGVVFLFVPSFFGGFTGTNAMTATTTATVVSVNNGSTSDGSCSAVVSYMVGNQHYQQQSAFSSSSLCSLTPGSTVTISYNPDQPGSWGYDLKSLNMFMYLFMGVGALVIVTSLVTFVIRLLSIIFGWKLLKSGRAAARALPAGTDFAAIIEQIKQEFSHHVFGGTSSNPFAPPGTQQSTTSVTANPPVESQTPPAPIQVAPPVTATTPASPASPQSQQNNDPTQQ